MTGATVIIRKNNLIIMGKVRHSGYDVEKFFGPTIFSVSFESLWPRYLKWRRKDFNPIDLGGEIKTSFDTGFRITASKIPSTWEKLIDMLHNLIYVMDPDDGYLCGYDDHTLFVNFNKRTIQKCGISASVPIAPNSVLQLVDSSFDLNI